jgi:hypothetical protein
MNLRPLLGFSGLGVTRGLDRATGRGTEKWRKIDLETPLSTALLL